jgi:hypothetical protein
VSCELRVEATGWRVKKGGKEYWGRNWKAGFMRVVVEVVEG